MRKSIFLKSIAAGLLALGLSTPAAAVDWSADVHVTVIEATYVPEGLIFQVDSNVGTCAAGTFLSWNVSKPTEATKIANVQAVLSLLMTAKATNQKVRIFGNNAGCRVDFIWIL